MERTFQLLRIFLVSLALAVDSTSGSDLLPPLPIPFPPLSSPQLPEISNGIVPLPSNPVESPDSSITSPPLITELPPPPFAQVLAPPPNFQGDVFSSPIASPEKAPAVKPPFLVPVPASTPLRESPKVSPVALSPHWIPRNAPNKPPISETVAPAPVSTPLIKSPATSSATPPTIPSSLPPQASSRNSSNNHKAPPIQEPFTPAPVSTPLMKSPPTSSASPPTIPSSLPPQASPRNSSNNHKAPPIQEPFTPVASPPRISRTPPSVHPVVPRLTPYSSPEQSTSPMRGSPQSSPTIRPIFPGQSPSLSPDNAATPIKPPSTSINRKKVGIPVASPPNEMSKPLPPVNHSPSKGSSPAVAPSNRKSKMGSYHTAPSPNSPPNNEHHALAPSPLPASHRHQQAKNRTNSPAPASSLPISPPPPLKHRGSVVPPSSHHAPSPVIPGSLVSPSHPPVSSSTRHVLPAPSPSPASSHPISPPPPLQHRGSVVPPSSHHAPSPISPGTLVSPSHPPVSSSMRHVLPAPSPSPTEASPFRSSSRRPKVPLLPPLQAFPPPPPNADCSSTICTEPYTNTPPGSPCGCVWPMQVGLRLHVALYTFFPLVSEFAEEIAAGVFMKQSQVRIMGANAASEQPDKSVVLIDLVPLGEKFDNTTAFLIFQRFWNKKVVIKASLFGDYEVLYVHYPGLPSSPPFPPSGMTIIDEGPYSGNSGKGRTIKPLGVDVPKNGQKKGLNGGTIAIIVLSALAFVGVCSTVAWVLLFKQRDRPSKPAPLPRSLVSTFSKPSGSTRSITASRLSSASLSFESSIAPYTGSAKTFTACEIERATDNFNESRVLGEGGFGRVYSGVIEDGTKVAVKVLKRDDQQGSREFLAEVEMLSRLHHRNLVNLIGIFTEDRCRCLVYELIPNGSVESHLHGVDKDSAPLDWDARLKIALGAARGLAYLHEDSSPRVIHRDFKSSNILLEHDFTPKVSDFGLARNAMDEENRHISTRVMGTFGYVAPEYAMTGHLLVKSDVYSYGVVLLELLTGRKPVDMSQPPGQENLVAWARPLLSSKEGLEAIIDMSLKPDVPFDSVAKVAAIASMCVQPEVSHRPFMGEVVQALKLVCNESDEAKEIGSVTSTTQEDLSVNMGDDARDNSTGSIHGFPLLPNYDSEPDTERGGLSASEIFTTSARLEASSESFRRHSSSGPLRMGGGKRFWQRIRRLSGGSASEHGITLMLRSGSR